MEDLTGLDARFLYSETTAGHMHTLKIAVVDLSGRSRPLTPERFLEEMGNRLDRLPALRRRAVAVPFRLGHPVWVDDPAFDLARHVQWRTAHEPGGDHELAEVVAEVTGTPLRRDRPLWDLTVVDGLEGGKVAFVMKLHHALADGGAAVSMIVNAFLLDDNAGFSQPAQPEPMPPRRVLFTHALVGRWRQIIGLPRFLSRSVTGMLASRQAKRRIGVALPGLFTAPRTPINVSLDVERTFAMTSLPLDDLLAVKSASGATLNDVFLAICGGALRQHLARRGWPPIHDLTAGVPIATRPDEQHFSGNHVDNLIIGLGVDLVDDRERLERIHRTAAAARNVRKALGLQLFEDRAEMTPPILYSLTVRLWALTRLANRTRPPLSLIASNVAGPRSHLELDGGLVTALYSVGPLLEGVGLNITAWSYAGQLHVSVLGCPTSLPDPWDLADGLVAAAHSLAEAFATT